MARRIWPAFGYIEYIPRKVTGIGCEDNELIHQWTKLYYIKKVNGIKTITCRIAKHQKMTNGLIHYSSFKWFLWFGSFFKNINIIIIMII